MDFHQPVLLNHIVNIFLPETGKHFIDATLGNGGHTIALLQKGATVTGLDQDPSNLKIAITRINTLKLSKNFTPVNINFSDLTNIISNSKNPINGVLFDLGLSLNQLKSNNRGFSFNDRDSLDMRLNQKQQELTAEYIINTYDESELFLIFSIYAQESYSKDIASLIVKHRHHHPFKNSADLSTLIKTFYLSKKISTRLHPATKILMALRIATNHEYENLTKALTACLSLPNAIIAIISFHSGEDRLVKNFIRSHHDQICQIQKPIKPDLNEQNNNPLSRSALLRVFKIK